MRETTQKPVQSEMLDSFNGERSSNGMLASLFSIIPGVGILAAVTGDLVATAAISSASQNAHDADQAKQAEASTYKEVQAVEFKFDDGEVINIPVYVASGMLYKVGRRLNAMVSPKYGTVALGRGVLFWSVPTVGESDYDLHCRIDNAEDRKTLLNSTVGLVDEARIVNAKERRLAAIQAPKTDEVAVNGTK